jgi:dipeptidase
MKKIAFLGVLFLAIAIALPAWACTVTLTGKKATLDGSVMVSHSDDDLNDPRMIYVPAMNHKPGSLRPVFYAHYALDYKPQWGASETQRMMTRDRGPGYDTPGIPPSVPLGYIPQAPHTYAYFDTNYGIMNEHQLSIGECTDKAKVHPEPEAGKRIFYSAELSRVALERTKTAREAVKLIGELIDKYGYYGTGETLVVADPEEGWVMEMCGYDMNGTGGVWVTQQVPDDGFFVAANQFRIRNIRKGAGDMMYSANIFEVAEKKGWWKPESGDLDWTSVVYGDGEFHHPYYSLRRVWRAQSMIAPSLNLPAWVEGPFTQKYRFAVKPDNRLTVANIFAIHRDNYEGTEFDLTKGLAAGPFGNPNRFEGQAEGMADKEGRLTPLKAVFMPFYAGATDLPVSMQKADILKFDKGSMWIAFNYVANYAMLKYSYMIKDIAGMRDGFEARAFGKQKELEQQANDLWMKGDQKGARKLLTGYSAENTSAVLREWWKLSEDLYIKYNDGYLNTKAGIAQAVFYPTWWLKQVGYENGPTSYEKPATGK